MAVLPMVERMCALHNRWDSAKYGLLPDPGSRYRSWLGQRAEDPRSVFLVAERPGDAGDERSLVGYIVGMAEQEIPIYRVRAYGFVHDLWIEPDYRNEGLGRRMVMLAVERFRGMGVEQIRLDVWHGNEPARKLFESCGFRASVVEMLLEL